ncbi:hypothetical protein [Variovorax sp. 1615]|uniref:hypothetical protein n=1 Tax=Variovorax sp. UC122_21 TaxID=3374554 RepID=UPI001AE33833
MASFFIEMGQGILAPGYDPAKKTGELRVTTSDLWSCALIAGHNASTGWAGAFHYPSGELSSNAPLEIMFKRSRRGYDSDIDELDWSLENLSEVKRRLECGIKTTDGLLSWIQTLRPTTCAVLEGRESDPSDMNRLQVFLEGHGRMSVTRSKALGAEVAMRSSSEQALVVADRSRFEGIAFQPRLDVQNIPAGRHWFGDPQEMFIVDGHNVSAKVARWVAKNNEARVREARRSWA